MIRRPPAGVPPPSLALRWRALRPYSFAATLVPLAVGSAAALDANGRPAFLLLIPVTIFVLAIHGAVNLFNDLEDLQQGVDTSRHHGTGGILASGALLLGESIG